MPFNGRLESCMRLMRQHSHLHIGTTGLSHLIHHTVQPPLHSSLAWTILSPEVQLISVKSR